MPRYDYRCTQCGNVEEIIHGFNDEHSFHCVTCGRAMSKLISSVNIAPSATPSRNSVIDLEATKKAEKAKDADMSAYKRLRQSGLQPKSINGSAHLEKHAETKSEIQAGRLYSSDASRKESERLMNSIEAV
jgi:putative FmdB family regulatory protein